jgi:triosephosphate isomerase
MKKLIIANWKMHPATLAEAVSLARASDQEGIAVAAPFPYLAAVAAILKCASVAAQDVSVTEVPVGPRTGEVSGAMLKSLGVQYVIVGHSERRAAGDSEKVVAAKLRASLVAGLTPILCVGEPWSVRRRGFAASRAFVGRQLTSALSRSSGRIRPLVAYEPVWAISTSKHERDETPEDAARMAQFINKQLVVLGRRTRTRVRRLPHILYGGSVNASNAAVFLSRPEFSGILVGGASLSPHSFRDIARVARTTS